MPELVLDDHALLTAFYQLVGDDRGTCAYCDNDARFAIATGADPEPEALCGTHVLPWHSMLAGFIYDIGRGEAPPPPPRPTPAA